MQEHSLACRRSTVGIEGLTSRISNAVSSSRQVKLQQLVVIPTNSTALATTRVSPTAKAVEEQKRVAQQPTAREGANDESGGQGWGKRTTCASTASCLNLRRARPPFTYSQKSKEQHERSKKEAGAVPKETAAGIQKKTTTFSSSSSKSALDGPQLAVIKLYCD